MDKKTVEKLKIKLEREKQSLEEELKGFAEKDEKTRDDWKTRFPEFNGDHLEEAADEVEEYSTMLPIEHALEIRLRNVNLALEKLKKEKYGICEKCKKKIPEERLTVSPEARFCMECGKKK